MEFFSGTNKILKDQMRENYPEYLSKTPEYEINENNYLRILWSPLLEMLFVEDKSIRIIW